MGPSVGPLATGCQWPGKAARLENISGGMCATTGVFFCFPIDVS
jgi:hypothetical protein